MGFFTDLKVDLSQAVNELVDDKEKIDAIEPIKSIEPIEQIEPIEPIEPIELKESIEQIEQIQRDNKEEVINEIERFINKDVIPESVKPEVKKEKYVVKKMEERKMTREKESLDETALITRGMTIVGDVNSKGSIDVLGEVIGNVTALGKLSVVGTIQGDSKASEVFIDSAQITGEIVSHGTVKIGASSVIIGNITACCAVIAGAIKGDIDVKGPVVLDASAIVMGNIKSKSVQINSGAVIEGLCSQCYADVSPTSFFTDIKKKK